MDAKFLRGKKAWSLGDVVVLVRNKWCPPDLEILQEELREQLRELIEEAAGSGSVDRVIDSLGAWLPMGPWANTEQAAANILDELPLRLEDGEEILPSDLDRESLEEMQLEDILNVLYARVYG